jgi:Transcription factor WhiB
MAVLVHAVPLDFARGRRDLPCRQPTKANWWFAPEAHNGTLEHDRDAAVDLCHLCPVMLECRRYALADRSIRDGVWGGVVLGGMSSNTRTRLLTQTRRELKEIA